MKKHVINIDIIVAKSTHLHILLLSKPIKKSFIVRLDYITSLIVNRGGLSIIDLS